jgi:hypothetical protein
MAFISTSQQHIDLLRRAASPEFPVKIYPGHREVDFALYQDLVTEFLVDARPTKDGLKIIMYAHRGITEKGLTELRAHQDQKEQATSIGWMRHNRTWLIQTGITFLLGLLSGLALAKMKGLVGD